MAEWQGALLLLAASVSVCWAAENRDCVKENKIWISKEGTEGCKNFCTNDLSFFPFKDTKACKDIVCTLQGPQCYAWTVKTCLTSTASFARKIKKKVPIPFPESVFSDKCKPVKDLCKALIDQKEDPRNTTYQKIVGNCLAVISLSIVEQDSMVGRLDFGMSRLLGLVSKLQDAASIFEQVVPQAMTKVKKFPGMKGSKKKRRKKFNKWAKAASEKYGQGNYKGNQKWRESKWNEAGGGGDDWGSSDDWGGGGGGGDDWNSDSSGGGDGWGDDSGASGDDWGDSGGGDGW